MRFRVGDRVKRVQTGPSGFLSPVPLGETGTVTVDNGGESVGVHWDNSRAWDKWDHEESWFRWTLAPLTPPAEDAWAADKVRELVKPKPMFQGIPLETVQ